MRGPFSSAPSEYFSKLCSSVSVHPLVSRSWRTQFEHRAPSVNSTCPCRTVQVASPIRDQTPKWLLPVWIVAAEIVQNTLLTGLAQPKYLASSLFLRSVYSGAVEAPFESTTKLPLSKGYSPRSVPSNSKLSSAPKPSPFEFEAVRRSNQKIILKHRACALQGPAHGGLAEEQARCCCGDAFLLGNRSKRNQEIQISLS